MIWKFITFFVRKLEPEIAHQISLIALKLGLHPRLKRIEIPVKINNLHFSNFLGVAYRHHADVDGERSYVT